MTIVPSRVAQFISKRIAQLSGHRTQAEIAATAGFSTSPNFLSMLKEGRAKVPLDRAVSLARALEADAVEFVWLVLNESLPQTVLDHIATKESATSAKAVTLAAAVESTLIRAELSEARRALDNVVTRLAKAEVRLGVLANGVSEVFEERRK